MKMVVIGIAGVLFIIEAPSPPDQVISLNHNEPATTSIAKASALAGDRMEVADSKEIVKAVPL